MLDGDFVQLLESLGLGHSIVDHDGVDVLHVGDADELVDCGVVALIAFERRVYNCGEFAIIKRRVENAFPTADEIKSSFDFEFL